MISAGEIQMAQAQPKLLIGEKPTDTLRTPPAEGWLLRCFGAPLTIDGNMYPHSAIVPLSVLEGRNANLLLRQGRLRWGPPSTAASPKPKQLEAPGSAKPHQQVVLIGADDLDAVAAWKRTLDHMAAKYGGDYATAADRIRAFTVVKNGSTSRPGLSLYMR